MLFVLPCGDVNLSLLGGDAEWDDFGHGRGGVGIGDRVV